MANFESLRDKRVWKKGMAHLRKTDKVLARVIKKKGIIEVGWGPATPYEAIVSSFIYQQISGSAGASILKKFKKLYRGRLPTPRQFLKTPEKKVRSAGISPQKYSYIKDLCERLESGQLDLDGLKRLPDEEVVAVLDEVRGIGRWTAEMFLMFSLSRVDVFAMDDLGLQNAVMRVYGLRRRPTKEKMLTLSEKWHPYKSIASLYLWHSIDQDS